MSLEFAASVLVFANDALVYRTHSADASRLLSDGLAIRRCKGRKVRALDLVTLDKDCSHIRPAAGRPQKYTFVEALRGPYACECGGDPKCTQCGGDGTALMIDAHCHSLKPGIAHPKNWLIFRAALVDCLPKRERAQIRELFAPKRRQKQAA